jgi:hypothetical protein
MVELPARRANHRSSDVLPSPTTELPNPNESLEVVCPGLHPPPSVAFGTERAPSPRWRLDALSALEVVVVMSSDQLRPNNPSQHLVASFDRMVSFPGIGAEGRGACLFVGWVGQAG